MSSRILLVLSNHVVSGPDAQPVGFRLHEITQALHIWDAAGITTDFASPLGGEVVPEIPAFQLQDRINKRYHDDPLFRSRLHNTLPMNRVHPRAYQGVYVVGSAGALWDLPNCMQLQSVLADAYAHGAILAAIRFGVSAFKHVVLPNGSPLLEGKTITAPSRGEIRFIGLDRVLPFIPEDDFRAQGISYHKRFIPLLPNVRISERLITGQNAASVRPLARLLLKTMQLQEREEV